MTTVTKQLLATAKQLSDTDLTTVATELQDMVIARKLEASEASLAQDGGQPLATAFDRLQERYAG
ncbi:MAG: hypothetical protein AAFO63_00300 [Pseudomonadota bacterium]